MRQIWIQVDSVCPYKSLSPVPFWLLVSTMMSMVNFNVPCSLPTFTSFFSLLSLFPLLSFRFLLIFFPSSFSYPSSRGAEGASSSCWQFLVLERVFYYTLICERECQKRFPGVFWHRGAERTCSIRRKSLSLRALKACRRLPSPQKMITNHWFCPSDGGGRERQS